MYSFCVLAAALTAAAVGGFFLAPAHVVYVKSPPEIVYERVTDTFDVQVPVPYEVVKHVTRYVPVPVEHTVYRIVNHYSVKRIPRQCPSVADALNGYELDTKRGL